MTACEAAGVPGRLHLDFRRTAVRTLVQAGLPDTVAMEITGHETHRVFDRDNIARRSGRWQGKKRKDDLLGAGVRLGSRGFRSMRL